MWPRPAPSLAMSNGRHGGWEEALRRDMATVLTSVQALHRRVDDVNTLASDRHAEVLDRFEQINGKVNHAHQRLAGLDALVSTMQAEIQRIRDRYHKFINEVQAQISAAYLRAQGADGTRPLGDGAPVTRLELRQVFWILMLGLGAGAGAILWILKITGKIP